MTETEIRDVLDKHRKWIKGEAGGSRANLSRANLGGANLSGANLSRANLGGANLIRADLSGANLSSAYLSSANLSSAYLIGADLSSADLSRANLSSANLGGAYLIGANLSRANLGGANLSGADLGATIYDGICWLAHMGIVPIDGKARAYKLIDASGKGPFQGGINYLASDTFEAECDPDKTKHCSKGINLATFAWCLNNKRAETNRLLLMEFDASDAVVPLGTDGKFRVSKCRKIGECDWRGNLIPAKKKA